MRVEHDTLPRMSDAKVVSNATLADAAAPLPAGAKSELIADPSGRLVVSANIAMVNGVLVAPVTPGVLPVEFTAPNWLKTGPVALPDAGLLIKAGAGRLQRVEVTIYTSGTALCLQIHDKAALPPLTANRAWGSTPVPAAAGNSWSLIDVGWEDEGGLDFTNGLVITLSAAGLTYVAPAGTSAEVTVYYL